MRCILFGIAELCKCRGYRAGTDSTAPNSSLDKGGRRERRLDSYSEGLEMIDSWMKESPSGKTVTFKIEGDRKCSFVYSAGMAGRDIKKITGSLKVLTREDVETMFVNYVAGR